MAITCARADILCAFFLVAFLCLLPGSESISITNFTVPKSVIAGEDAELICQYELTPGEPEGGVIVKWWWTPQNAGKEANKQLYQRIGKQQPIPIVTDISTLIKEGDTIVVQNMQPDYSGTFECEVSVTIDEARSHETLVVYSPGSGPELNASSVPDGDDSDQEDDVLIKCSASNVAPEPQLTLTIDTVRLSQEEVVSDLGGGWYNVSTNATVSKSEADGKDIRCELFYEHESVGHPAWFQTLHYQAKGAEATTEPEALAIDADNTTEYVTEHQPDAATCQIASPLVIILAFFSISFYC